MKKKGGCHAWTPSFQGLVLLGLKTSGKTREKKIQEDKRNYKKKNDFWEQPNWRFTKKGKNNYSGVNWSHAEVATS